MWNRDWLDASEGLVLADPGDKEQSETAGRATVPNLLNLKMFFKVYYE